MELNIGDRFKATDKLGKITYWKVTNRMVYPDRGVLYPFYDFEAIGEHKLNVIKEYDEFKKNNKHSYFNLESWISLLDIEQEWLNQRKIELINFAD
jgi:hypothetical protein